MIMVRKGFLVALLCLGMLRAFSQAPIAAFTAPSSACLGQSIIPNNTSSNAIRYEWDLCQGDLGLTPSVAYLGAIGGAVTLGVDVVTDGTNWFGFVTSRETNSIIRLDFGTDYNSVPTRTDLGNVSGNLGRPVDIRVIRDGGKWYGFVYSEATANTLISRINFGSSLQNTTASATPITADVVLPGNGVFNSNGGFDMVQSGSEWVIVYTQPNSIGIARLTTIASIPAASDLLMTGALGSTTFGDLKLIRTGNQWFGYTSDFQNRELYRFSFGTSPFMIPTSVNLGSSWFNGQTPYGLDGGFDNGSYYLLVSTSSGNLQRINLGADLTTTPISGTSLGNFSLLSSTFKIKLFNHASQWVAFSVDYSNQHFYRIPFPSAACNTSPSFSNLSQPTIRYTSAGSSYITLRAFNADGNFDQSDAPINVLNATAPIVDFQAQNSCAQFPVLFSSQSPQSLTSFQWDFGNGDVSNQSNPSETFSAAGKYTVGLTATATNGCSNFVSKAVDIYTAPVASFNMPSPSISCTNQTYVFQNTSSTDPASSPTWQWNVNGSPVSTLLDLQTTFANVTSQSIQLIASLPGCSSQQTQTFVVQQQGPVVNFTNSIPCSGKTLQFTNQSSGNITGYTWDFGDGQTTSVDSPQKTYSGIGTFDVKLTASNPLGCNNTATRTITVYSTPQPQFSIELPPFSCTGSPSQFTDSTPMMTDSNVSSWSWSFGDLANGTSSAQNPTYTFATANNYSVSLTTGTDRGCFETTVQQVTIAQSPVADFTHTPVCVNASAMFSDASGTGIKSWSWLIDGSVSTSQNPEVTFISAGAHSVQLTVTAANNCIGKITKAIDVPVPLAASFSVDNACVGNQATLANTTVSGNDPIAKYIWNFDGGETTSGSSAQHIFSAAGSSPVSLSLTTESGCIYTRIDQITINPVPEASFDLSTEQGVAPLGVRFTNTSSGASTYLWTFDGRTSTAVSPFYSFNQPGDFIVNLVATNQQGCSASADRHVIVTEPQQETIEDPWPNPVHSKLHLQWTLPSESDVKISIFTIQGVRVVDTIYSNALAGATEWVVDTLAWPPGVYVVRIELSGTVRQFRVVVN